MPGVGSNSFVFDADLNSDTSSWVRSCLAFR
jgi:hypothetical protein